MKPSIAVTVEKVLFACMLPYLFIYKSYHKGAMPHG